MTRILFKTLAALAFSSLAASSLMAAPVLTNGDFELTPPSALGNNLTEPGAAAPWIFGAGNAPNVVKVDGPGGYEYYNNGPESDASGAGAGVEQHYLDIANGANDFYQVFTPLCTGEVTYSAAFSTRANSAGEAGITILADADGSIVGPRHAITLAGGASKTDPWAHVSFSTTLTANTAYRFHVDMNNNMNMDNAEVRFQTDCAAHSDLVETTTKTCEAPVMQADGSITVACDVFADFPNGAGFMQGEAGNLPLSIVDTLTLNGTPMTGVNTLSYSNDPWACADGPFAGFMGDTDATPRTVCTLDGASALAAATSGATGQAGMTSLTLTATFPPGSTGTAQNCAYLAYFLAPDAASTTEPSCVDIVLPDPETPLPRPVQCEAFTPEVTCDTVTGKPVVTLKNKYANLFSPKAVQITSLTPGVTVQQSQSNALSVQLTGAGPGDTVSLSTEAVEVGAGSEPGLDLCCMGEIEVTIPEGFVCEPEQVLEVTKTCDTGVNPAIDTDADCEITVHYEGPPPSASNPIKIVEAVTGNPWAFTTTPLSGDNWNCPPVADATPFTCTISAADEPGANWQNWTSTLIVQMSVGEEFENCVTATAAGGLEDRVCWSTEMPELTIEKLADQEQCTVGQPCSFTVTVSNPSGVDYSGPVTINDQIVSVTPPALAGAGSFTAITPPLCAPSDLATGSCTGPASIAAGSSQSYQITWIPPAIYAGVEADVIEVTNCASGVSQAGVMSVTGAPDAGLGEIDTESCASVEIKRTDVSILKTGPDQCLPGQACDYQITVSSNSGYNGPVLLGDQAPAGFQITSITPATSGCGGNLPADMLYCVVPVSLSAGESIGYTISITPMPGTLDTAYVGDNCALLASVPAGTEPVDYSFSGHDIPEALSAMAGSISVLGESCAPVVWNPPEDSADADIVKTCEPVQQVGPDFMAACTITVTTTGPIQTYLTVADSFAGMGQVNFVTTEPGWICGVGQCEIDGSNLNQTASVSTFGVEVTFPAGAEASGTNCGILGFDAHEHARSCVDIVSEDDGDPPPPTIAKTCAPAVAGPLGLTSTCTIVVTSNATSQPHHLTVTETLGQYLDASDTGASITGFSHADPWVLGGTLPIPPATPFTLTLPGAAMPASGQSTITVSVQLMNEGYLMETDNCATVQAYDAANQPVGASQQACADFPPPSSTSKLAPDTPDLSVAKTSTGPCVADVAAQTYACGFDLKVTNAGANFAGPMVLGDAFDPGMVSAVSATGAGWSCNLAVDAASCINGNLSLATGASATVSLDVTVKGLPNGGTFGNCARIGASDDPTAQAIIVQTALTLMGVDIGAVDGKPGKRTRAAVADLQTQLGLDPTGEIDARLLGALGVPMASDGDEACVTVDLPPMPRPPVQCEKATTKLVEGECVCRFKNMYQADRTSCGCVKGTEFVAGEGCIKVREKPKDPPAALKCDPNTTVLRNGKCQCREEGMEKISKTACAKPKKKSPDIRICPNGLPEIPGVGCVDFKIEPEKDGGGRCNPAVQECG